MGIRVWTSLDIVRTLEDPVGYSSAYATHIDAVMDASDTLWVARAISGTQSEVSYTPQLYSDPIPARVVGGKLDGAVPVWLKCPEGTIYLFSGKKSYQLDTVNKALLPDSALSHLADITAFWTWAWRGDELWMAPSGPIGLTRTRDRGRTYLGGLTPPNRERGRHPRVVIAPTGEMAVVWWRGDEHGTGGALVGAITRNYADWIPIPPFQAVVQQRVGALFMGTKVVVSFVDPDGTVQRIECDSVTDAPVWS